MKMAIVIDEPRFKHLPTKEGIIEDKLKKETMEGLKKVLSKKFDCIDLVFDDKLVTNLKREKVDLVFNLCNGINGDSRLSQLPAILEHANIPYTASKPLGHGLAYDKMYSCKLFKEAGISIPEFSVHYDTDGIEDLDIEYPIIVKPNDEGSSRGIHENSLVNNLDDLIERVNENLEVYNPPIMISEYIEGREFTVGVIGNGEDIRVLPILEVDFSNLPDHLNKIYSFEVKVDYGDETTFHVPAKLDDNMRIKIEKMAIDAYNTLGIKDYGRVDFRLKNGIPYVLEINSLPGLKKGYSDITKMADACGLGFEGLIMEIVHNAVERYDLDYII